MNNIEEDGRQGVAVPKMVMGRNRHSAFQSGAAKGFLQVFHHLVPVGGKFGTTAERNAGGHSFGRFPFHASKRDLVSSIYPARDGTTGSVFHE
jgi:hypothetical protein